MTVVGELSPIPAMNRNNDIKKRNNDRFLNWCCIFQPFLSLQLILYYKKDAVAGAEDSSPTFTRYF